MSGWFDDGTEENSEAEAQAEASEPSNDETPGDEEEAGQERHRVTGDDLLAKVKEIVREGNVRKITIRNEEDKILLSFPLAAGVLGAALLPMWAAIGAVAALVGNCSIDVERRE